MYLKNLKLSGFKSFVDTTNIPIRGHLMGIVGPNGCGKSNVVDALRWVIGESSAKELRAQSMAEVIFNGTTTRKPVGKALVELLFDNSEGRMGGEFAKYNEIAVRREVERDGQSSYFINNTSCRRRDVLDLFLGTGLGPRSYSIIEQGMVSQLVEAKPENMRSYFEEVAGISKYKERRRETETRMRHTQENLDRLNDLLEELKKQQQHLQRQANAAERYKVLKEQERLLQAQVKALQYKELNEQLQQKNTFFSSEQLALDEKNAVHQQIETAIEKTKLWQAELMEKQNLQQKEYYQQNTEIMRIEQQIQHEHEQITRWQRELNEAENLWQELTHNSAQQLQQQEKLQTEIAFLIPQSQTTAITMQQALENLQNAEKNSKQWQVIWEDYQQQTFTLSKERGITETKKEHHQSRAQSLIQRIKQLQEKIAEKNVGSLEAEIEPLTSEVAQQNEELQHINQQLLNLKDDLALQRQTNQQIQQNLEQYQQKLQQLESQYASLNALQQAALSVKDDAARHWLTQQQLIHQSRLGKELQVTDGWETAVETVLSYYLNAICVDNIAPYLSGLDTLQKGELMLIDKEVEATATTTANTLSNYVLSSWPVGAWLNTIYVADDLAAALERQKTLLQQESVITRQGLWLGRHWVRVHKALDNRSGILQREQQLTQLHAAIQNHQSEKILLQQERETGERKLREIEQAREEKHRLHQQQTIHLAQLQSNLQGKKAHLQALQQQHEQWQKELQDCHHQAQDNENNLAIIQAHLQMLQQQQQEWAVKKSQLELERDQHQQVLEQARTRAEQEKQKFDAMNIQLKSYESQNTLLQQTLAQAKRQLEQVGLKHEQLQTQLSQAHSPLEEKTAKLQKLLSLRKNTEEQLHRLENEVAVENAELKTLEEKRHQWQIQIHENRERLQQLSLQQQTLKVQQENLQEQIVAADFVLVTLLNDLPATANILEWQTSIEHIASRINRLGAINLAAIEEYQNVTERKEYLEKQQTDLIEALTVLQNAIKKIDKETRNKFKETFDQVNEKFKETFPQIFGGGRAELELLDEDLLATGIVVRAQPPGKRNSTIQMLSGGEKALTAIALIFALFYLNPAPFCILDEVDAPLDDLNVGRFCQLIKAMSKNTQFIVVSHNKVTIQHADYLMGVTMQEPGVSRIVSVDMEQAVEMAS